MKKYAMWKFIVDVVYDFVSSLQPDVGRGFLHVSNVFLLKPGFDVLKWTFCLLICTWGTVNQKMPMWIAVYLWNELCLNFAFM